MAVAGDRSTARPAICQAIGFNPATHSALLTTPSCRTREHCNRERLEERSSRARPSPRGAESNNSRAWLSQMPVASLRRHRTPSGAKELPLWLGPHMPRRQRHPVPVKDPLHSGLQRAPAASENGLRIAVVLAHPQTRVPYRTRRTKLPKLASPQPRHSASMTHTPTWVLNPSPSWGTNNESC